ncbi:MAG TPA: HNH endonuclease [Armatimonadota bacterium]|jgi:hypothetical protein
MKIPITGAYVHIDDEDVDLMQQRWYLLDRGQVFRTRRVGPRGCNRRIGEYLARMVAARAHETPAGKWRVRHINGDLRDCRRDNLEIVPCKTGSVRDDADGWEIDWDLFDRIQDAVWLATITIGSADPIFREDPTGSRAGGIG